MALTVTVDKDAPQLQDVRWVTRGTIDFDASYASGGETLKASEIALRLIEDIEFTPRGGYLVYTETVLPATSITVKLVAPTGGAAPASIADPSVAVPSGATAVTSSAAQPNLTETGGRGVEVAAAADVSSITKVRFRAWGV